MASLLGNKDKEKKVDKTVEALITERGVRGNANLDKIASDLVANYKPKRHHGSMREFRVDHTAMIPNDKPIYVFQSDEKGERFPQMLFAAGWYLSLEENHVKEEALKDPEVLELNEKIWAAMEAKGMPVEKQAGVAGEVKVVA